MPEAVMYVQNMYCMAYVHQVVLKWRDAPLRSVQNWVSVGLIRVCQKRDEINECLVL